MGCCAVQLFAFAILLRVPAALLVNDTETTAIAADSEVLTAIQKSDLALVMAEAAPSMACMVLKHLWTHLGQEFPGRLWHVSCAEAAGAAVCAELPLSASSLLEENPAIFTWTGTSFEHYTGTRNTEALVAYVRETVSRRDGGLEADREQEASNNNTMIALKLHHVLKQGDVLARSLIHNTHGSILLKGFSRIPSSSVSAALAHTMIPSKRDYFDYLKHVFGYKSGVQTEEHGGLCLATEGGARLLDASCLISSGFRWVVFVGDSLVREQAASFFRHTLAEEVGCQPWGEGASLDSKSLNQTHVNCTLPPSESCQRTLCERNATGGPPCEAFHSTYIIVHARPHELDVAMENLTTWVAAHPCPGIVVTSGNDLHFLWLEKNSKVPTKSSRTLAWIKQFYDVVKRGNAGSILVWASTPKPNVAIMNLPPPKADLFWWKEPLSDFGQLGLLDVWYQTELQLFANRQYSGIPDDVLFLPVNDLYDKYSGLMCDGIHTGAFPIQEWGCRGFLVVTDMLIQVLLNRICAGTVIRVA
jgi:hypothetical protein